MKKRITAFLVAASMLFTMSPITAYADSEEEAKGYHPVDLEPLQTETERSGLRAYSADGSEEYPQKYDARSLLPTVRDQGIYNTCWAFSAIASAEASMIAKGLATSTLNLSEYHLAYFFYHHDSDPLDNTKGDATYALTSNFADQGGNSAFTTWALAGWQGAAGETLFPYSALSGSSSLSSSSAYEDTAHMQNAYWFSLADRSKVKQMVMDYGAVNMAYRDISANYDSTRTSYYDSSASAQTGNHAVTIVGWDDTYDKSKFTGASGEPSADGAWLVRNSWGTSTGESGYFWISYEDGAMVDTNSMAFVFAFEQADNYTYNYQYDGSNSLALIAVNSGGEVANRFTVKTSRRQLLEAAAIGIYDTNVSYKLSIYLDPSQGDPKSGTLKSTQSGVLTEAGYHTIQLQTPVVLDPGHTFSVVFELTKSSGSSINLFVDASGQNGGWIQFVNSTAAGQSFLRNSTSSSWTDLHTMSCSARVKAFTRAQDCLHTSQTTTVTKANATTKTAGKIVTTCDGCGASISTSSISAPNKITLGATSYTYDGKTKKPSVKVYDKAGKVISSGNYTVTYASGRKTPGTYKVKVTFNSANYTGSLSTSFKITVGKVRVSAASQTTDSITLKWKKIYGASRYDIYRYDSAKKKYVRIKRINSGSTVKYKDTSVKTGKTYKYKIRAYCQKYKTYGSYSEILTTGTKPKKVTSLKVSRRSKTSVKLTWKKVSGASGYQIYRYNASKKKYVKIATIKSGTTIKYTNSKLKSGKTYRYKVRAYRSVNGKNLYGSSSEALKVKTK